MTLMVTIMHVLFRIFRFLRRNLSCLRLCGSPRRLPYPITFNPLLLFSEKFAVRGNNHVTPQRENVTFQISVTFYLLRSSWIKRNIKFHIVFVSNQPAPPERLLSGFHLDGPSHGSRFWHMAIYGSEKYIFVFGPFVGYGSNAIKRWRAKRPDTKSNILSVPAYCFSLLWEHAQ